MSVLIVTLPNDYHSHAVQWAIRQLGGDCDLFYPADLCDGAEWCLRPDRSEAQVKYRGVEQRLRPGTYDSIWMRRVCGSVPQLSISDTKQRLAAEMEFIALVSDTMRILEDDAFVASPLSATRTAGGKTLQLAVAQKVGLPIPRTIISNCEAEILDFMSACGGEIIYKPIKPIIWAKDDGSFSFVPTTSIDHVDFLKGCELKSSPGIFQEKIKKSVEIRVSIFGKSVVAWEKRFPDRVGMDVDWRFVHNGAVHRPHEMPADIVEKSIALLGELGLVMGIFDFVVDEDGRYFFLEVNPQGMFLWGDGLCPELNHLECVAQFLMSKDKNFRYEQKNLVSVARFESEVDFGEAVRREMQQHYGDVSTYHYGTVTVPLLPEPRLLEEA